MANRGFKAHLERLLEIAISHSRNATFFVYWRESDRS